MFKNLFKKKVEKKFIILGKSSFTKEEASNLQNRMGENFVVILSDDVADVKVLDEEVHEKGDGKATFFGDPTPAEELQYQRELEGTDKWYKRILG